MRAIARDPDHRVRQIGDLLQFSGLGRDEHSRLAPHDQHGMGLALHRGVGTHDRELDLAGLKHLERRLRALDHDDLDANRRALGSQCVRRQTERALVEGIAGGDGNLELVRAEREMGDAKDDR